MLSSHNLIAAALGVSSHLLLFIRGEHHEEGPLWLGLYLLIALVIFVGQMMIGHVYAQDAALAVLWVMTSFSTSLFTSILIYRIFFHRLRSFPGPFLAKTTKFWHVSKVARRSDNFRQLDSLYHRYGEFVRTGPNEVTMFSPEALNLILGSGSKCTKTSWYDVLKPLVSLNSTRDKSLHDRRRRIWNRGFSSKALHGYEERVAIYTQEFYERISQSAGRSINVTSWTRYFSFDVMGDFAFGHSFDMMRNEQNHFAVDILRQGMAVIGPFTPVPWLFIIGKSVPGLASRWKRLLHWAAEQMKSRLEVDLAVPDIMSYIIQASKENSSIEDDLPYLAGDSAAIVIAGSDTVASALTFIFYYLAKYPHETRDLRAEITALETPWDLSTLDKCDRLNGFINETLRLHPPVPSGVLRNTPREGLVIGDRYIPADTTVLVPIYTLGRRADCFEFAEDFIPTRWYSQKHLVKNKDAFAPFSIGSYSCIGKHLALMEIRSIVSRIVREFDVSFAPGEDGKEVMGAAKDTFTLSPGELQLVFHPIKR
ncbi:hypothetical protein N7G274_003372 [Stereocaulon virgatum]|uniref:Cytochrome P450 n=1 Tax=Stereocaulon virgatum TaxID=373712 RepID=A0ABR4ADE7_9LECA